MPLESIDAIERQSKSIVAIVFVCSIFNCQQSKIRVLCIVYWNVLELSRTSIQRVFGKKKSTVIIINNKKLFKLKFILQFKYFE